MSHINEVFVIYSRNGCPYCTKIERVLQLTELKYIVYKLDKDFDRNEFYEKFGKGSTFPQVMLGETPLGGCTDTVKYLKENSYV